MMSAKGISRTSLVMAKYAAVGASPENSVAVAQLA
jgi:hypothetical protein